jgi:hypothetical protein
MMHLASNRVDEPRDQTAHIVNLLFQELKASFPAFRQAWPTDEDFNRAKLTWVRAFADAKINTIEQLRHGIKKCRLSTSPFAPSVGQFIQWCSPSAEDFNLWTKEQAYSLVFVYMRGEKIEGLSEDQKLILQHVIQETDAFFLKSNTMSKTMPVFFRNYEIAVRDFLNGKLKPIARAIENKVHETQERAKQEMVKNDFSHLRSYEANMAEIKRELGINSNAGWPALIK